MATVTLSRTEYQILKRKAAKYEAAISVPAYYLKGKAAIRLDRRVEGSLREYVTGRTRKIKSLADL